MKSFIVSLISNRVLANVTLATILIVGLLAVINTNREVFPEFSIDIIQVRVPYPGADPEETEEGISRKIEDAVDGLEGVRRYNTTSREDVATANIEVAEDYEVGEVRERVRSEIDAIPTFPPDAEQPIISDVTRRTEVIKLALWGEDLTERQLKEWAEDTRRELQRRSGISQVTVLGTRDYEIHIEVSEERLRKYGLTFEEVSNTVRRENLNLTGGTVRTEGEHIRLRTVGRKYTGEEIASIVALSTPQAEVITLDRIADIRDQFSDDPVYTTFNGEPSVTVAVYRTGAEDSVAIAEEVREYANEQQAQLPPTANITPYNDASERIQSRIDLLVRNGVFGLILIFGLLWLFLDARLSFWVGVGVPLSLAGGLIVLWLSGGTLNMVSVFGFIVVLGIIVDDAIVIGEAIYLHRKSGHSPLMAAVNGLSEVGLPILTALTTTIVAFIPLFFDEGMMGKFFAILPLVVVSALCFSIAKSLFLMPSWLSTLPDLNARSRRTDSWVSKIKTLRQEVSSSIEWFVERVYMPVIDVALRWRYIVIASSVSLALIVASLVATGVAPFVMFPPADSNSVTATVEFYPGTPVEVTQEAVSRYVEALREVEKQVETGSGAPMVKHVNATAGQKQERFEPQEGSHYGQIEVELLNTSERDVHFQRINRLWEEETGKIPGAISQTYEGEGGGPGGADLEIWLQGEDMDAILSASEELQDRLGNYDGVYQVDHDYRPGGTEFRIDLKPEAYTLGLRLNDLAEQLHSGYFGSEPVRLQRGRDDVRIKVRYPREHRQTIGELERIRIRTPQGHEVPFLSVADVSAAPGYSTINRTDGLRRVVVTAEVDSEGATPQEIVDDMQRNHLPSLEERYPGLLASFQGQQEEVRDSMASLVEGFSVAIFIIFLLISAIFRSYIQPFLIMLTIPFGFIGAVFGHMLLGYPLTIMTMFGMVALAGVVVNAAILLIEKVNTLVGEGVPFYEALKRAGARRFRAIFLTTVSTSAGLAPMILETDMQAQFLIPMALTVAAGVLFSALLTLIFLPSQLGVLNDIRRLKGYLLKGEWPTPEEVEPGWIRAQSPDLGGEAIHPSEESAQASS